MKLTGIIASVFSTLLLSACASVYEPPGEAQSVKFAIVNKSGGITYATTFKNATDCSGGKQVISPNGIAPQATLETRVPVGADFSFFITTTERISVSAGLISFSSCFVPMTFIPENGVSYAATFEVAAGGGGCLLSITGTDKKGGEVDAKARRRVWQKPFGESGSFCRIE